MARRRPVKTNQDVILVVDDQDETLVSTKALLEHEGHVVIVAPSGEVALSIFQENHIDLVLVDYFMPRMDGDELVRAIRSIDPFVQIILQTAYAGQKPPLAMFAELDIQGYHDKVEGPEKLLQWVEVALKARDKLREVRARERSALREPLATAEKILLVGDRRTFAWLGARLAADGCRVVSAPTAAAALEAFVAERPQIMVITRDPGWIDTVNLVHRARALEPALPVILHGSEITAHDRAQMVSELECDAVHDSEEGPERLIELVEASLCLVRRLRRSSDHEDLRWLLVARFCHQVRSSIHVLNGYAEIIRDEATEPQVKSHAERLVLGGESVLELLHQYLDLTRLESPGVVVLREAVDIDELLAELAAIARRRIGERPLSLEILIPASGLILHTDGEKLRAILAELLMNSVKFSESGKLLLQVRCVAGGTEFVLHDSGPGLGCEDTGVLFEPFRQHTSDCLTSTPGVGLGLAISLRLSALLGGMLTVEPGPVVGTVFTLCLPTLLQPKNQNERVLLH